MTLGFYTDLCDEWELPTEEMSVSYASTVLKHRTCGGAVLLYFLKQECYDEARCQACAEQWRIKVVAEKVHRTPT